VQGEVQTPNHRIFLVRSDLNFVINKMCLVCSWLQVGPINVTEFKYRYTSEEQAIVLYSVGLHKEEELSAFKKRMEAAQMRTMDMTNNDLAKDHLRHLMGGQTKIEHELLYRFVFPERPGALMQFLEVFSPHWNITLFHYRSQGETGANVLVGLQVVKEDEQEFIQCADRLGYEYQDERSNEAFRLIMRYG
jgi:threonine dehydratase